MLMLARRVHRQRLSIRLGVNMPVRWLVPVVFVALVGAPIAAAQSPLRPVAPPPPVAAMQTPASALPKLTVRDAVELALRRHPATRVAAELTDAARARVGVPKSAYLPRIFFGAQW